jgi:DNA invertase Pin-like site-specific DNA recombinase
LTGWLALPDMYDDGGLSGGTMERLALKRLLEDIKAGKVQIVVVYKVDRLTRSLADFAKIVDVLDAHNASFVSVTQAAKLKMARASQWILPVMLPSSEWRRGIAVGLSGNSRALVERGRAP